MNVSSGWAPAIMAQQSSSNLSVAASAATTTSCPPNMTLGGDNSYCTGKFPPYTCSLWGNNSWYYPRCSDLPLLCPDGLAVCGDGSVCIPPGAVCGPGPKACAFYGNTHEYPRCFKWRSRCLIVAPLAPLIASPKPNTTLAWDGNGSGTASVSLVISGTDGNASYCCHKRKYPNPNPPGNPLPRPPRQSVYQKEIFALNAAKARNASERALPELTALVNACILNQSIMSATFSYAACPAMYATNASRPPTAAGKGFGVGKMQRVRVRGDSEGQQNERRM